MNLGLLEKLDQKKVLEEILVTQRVENELKYKTTWCICGYEEGICRERQDSKK